MSISMSNTRQHFPLSFKKIWKKTLSSFGCCFGIFLIFLTPVFFGLTVSILAAMGDSNFVISGFLISSIALLVVLSVILGLTYWYQKVYFNSYYYDLTESFIIIRKGVFTPREITIPYERVQDVYVDQDILDRLFGIYDVHLSSATVSSGFQAHIDGLEKPAADGLRQVLLKTINERIHKGQSPTAPIPNPSAP